MHILIGRDGITNRREPKGFIASWEEFEFLPGVREAQRDYKLVLEETLFVGDSELDACVARTAHCRFIRLATAEIGAEERGRQHAAAEVADLLRAVPFILQQAMVPGMTAWPCSTNFPRMPTPIPLCIAPPQTTIQTLPPTPALS